MEEFLKYLRKSEYSVSLLRKLSVSLVIGTLLITGCGSPQTSVCKSLNQSSQLALSTNALKNKGDIAFVDQGILYILDGNKGEVRKLINSGQAYNPIFSFDGQWIAYINLLDQKTLNGQLWLVRRDGQQAHQVKDVKENIYGNSYSWSPTTNVLIVNGNDEGLWLVPADGMPHLMVKGLISCTPSWSADGKSIAYSATLPYDGDKPENRTDELYALNVDSGRQIKHLTIPKAGINVAGWWPNGKGILYWLDPYHSASTAADGLYLWSIGLSESEPKCLLEGFEDPSYFSISSKETLLLVTGGDRKIWADKKLATIDLETECIKELSNPDGFVALDSSISPDGSSIVFVAAKDLGENISGLNSDNFSKWVATRTLWVENADGSGSEKLITAGEGVYNPVWSKDGNDILYERNNSLWIINRNGGNPVKVLGPVSDWQNQYSYSWYNQIT